MAEHLTITDLGPTSQSAIRRLLRLFHDRGWRDDGAALAIVRALPTTPSAAARRVPGDFYARNGATRADVRALLETLLTKPRPK